jgi:hypothetical protein
VGEQTKTPSAPQSAEVQHVFVQIAADCARFPRTVASPHKPVVQSTSVRQVAPNAPRLEESPVDESRAPSLTRASSVPPSGKFATHTICESHTKPSGHERPPRHVAAHRPSTHVSLAGQAFGSDGSHFGTHAPLMHKEPVGHDACGSGVSAHVNFGTSLGTISSHPPAGTSNVSASMEIAAVAAVAVTGVRAGRNIRIVQLR